ncbi:TetR/AcrR family transcriptional regulator [Ralstonia sp. CHL-2022]|uniref:TetR/AcrR family transcriptional regulator n=1 Tax=Ralstonia mojiangensis TaxID=2953895 RepID=A0AAE3LFG0_9RALS|nr:TetR/AcrR family transcriptional regulator [Ralstonia mojiangensis]MCT7318857.1 TetR/AcrR family transcriptional regulator [Ralstonia mojiangensis]MCT7329587.1 TetR/AcrR family transcriptional regulator [Ralstonia mojiangensis]
MSRAEQKALTRQRILEGSGRAFRKGGYAGTGVDALAKEAGVTSGAFYVHFDSKGDVFRESLRQGMDDLRRGVLHFQSEHGRAWWPAFVRFYLNAKRTCDLSESCTLQTLPTEVARSDQESRAAFEVALREVAQTVVDGPASPRVPRNLEAACSALASLVGAVTLARAVGSPTFADQIANAAESALLGSVRPR